MSISNDDGKVGREGKNEKIHVIITTLSAEALREDTFALVPLASVSGGSLRLPAGCPAVMTSIQAMSLVRRILSNSKLTAATRGPPQWRYLSSLPGLRDQRMAFRGPLEGGMGATSRQLSSKAGHSATSMNDFEFIVALFFSRSIFFISFLFSC